MAEQLISGRPFVQAGAFLSQPQTYDRQVRRFVPSYDEMLDVLLEGLQNMEPHNSSVLELGCRTGPLAGRLLREKPFAQLTAVDRDLEMILACKDALGSRAEWVELICQPEPRFVRPDAFDYILSHLMLHRIEGTVDKIAICRNAFQSLKPGGLFIFSAMIGSESEAAAEMTWKCWERDVLTNGVTPREIAEWHVRDRMESHPIPARVWLKWLRETGFIQADIIWSETVFGAIWARKPQ